MPLALHPQGLEVHIGCVDPSLSPLKGAGFCHTTPLHSSLGMGGVLVHSGRWHLRRERGGGGFPGNCRKNSACLGLLEFPVKL